MISTERYFIHIDNGSVVPWTSEIEGNYKFKEISFKVAMAIEKGTISTSEVLRQITRQIKPSTLDQMIEAKLKMNVREGELNLESQIKDDNSQKDTGSASPFDISLPGDAPRQQRRRAEKTETSENAGDEELAGKELADKELADKELADKVSATLEAHAPGGGVNV